MTEIPSPLWHLTLQWPWPETAWISSHVCHSVLYPPVCHFHNAMGFSFPFLSFPFPALTYSFLSYPIPFFPTRSKNLFPFPKLSYPIMSFPFLSHPIVRYPNLSYPVFSPSLISFLSFPFPPLSLSIFSFLFPNYYPSLSHHFNSFSFFFFFSSPFLSICNHAIK